MSEAVTHKKECLETPVGLTKPKWGKPGRGGKYREDQRTARRQTITEKVEAVLKSTIKDKIFVNMRRLCEHQNPTLPYKSFVDAVSDILTTKEVCEKFGVWVVTEYEGDLHALVRIFEPSNMKTPEEIVDGTESQVYHFFPL